MTKMVLQTVADKRLSHMDAVIDICETYNVDLEEIGRYISPIIKQKIQAEAYDLNFLHRTDSSLI